MKRKSEPKEMYSIGDKIYLLKQTGNGRYTSYKSAISNETQTLMVYALKHKLVRFENDAPRGGKYGNHYVVKTAFKASELKAQRQKEIDDFIVKKQQVVTTMKKDFFYTVSDIGTFIINGEHYDNFYGDAINTVEICECNDEEFANATYVTNRQIYEPNLPITIKKFDKPIPLQIAVHDCNEHEFVTIPHCLGFVIWERKLKIYVDDSFRYESVLTEVEKLEIIS